MLRARAGPFKRLGQNMRTSVHLDRGRDLRVGYNKSTSCDSMLGAWILDAYLCLTLGGSEPPRGSKACALMIRSAQYAQVCQRTCGVSVK
jgi:hypothetical protein